MNDFALVFSLIISLAKTVKTEGNFWYEKMEMAKKEDSRLHHEIYELSEPDDHPAPSIPQHISPSEYEMANYGRPQRSHHV